MRIVDGYFGEHLAIQHDAGLCEAFDESAICSATLTAGGRNACGPESAVVSLLLLPMNK